MMTGIASIEGTAAPGNEVVRDALETNFANFDEGGASRAVYVDGELLNELIARLQDGEF
jgi:hypothetical protein